MRWLKRVVERGYRDVVAAACYAHAARGGALALVLYDLMTLHFEADMEDRLRKVGMSKERRVDPQVTVGLSTTASGFPLEVHLFEGNKGETTTLIPVLTAFAARHQVPALVVVADAGMLSAANLLALEQAGFSLSSGPRPPAPRPISPTTFNGTGTRSATARFSRPAVAWARAAPCGSGGWSTSTGSNAPSTTGG